MLRRAALFALFALTPLGAWASDVEQAAVRTAKRKAKARTHPAEVPAGQAAAQGAKPKRRRRRRRRAKKAAPRTAVTSPLQSGPWLAFGLSMVATAVAGLVALAKRQRTIASTPAGPRDPSRTAELTDPYRREP